MSGGGHIWSMAGLCTVAAVPWGLRRLQQTNDLHFVTFSCCRRQPKLGTPGSRDVFERSLEQVRRRNKLYVTGYVVMPEHVHLVLSEPPKGRASNSVAIAEAIGGAEAGVARCGTLLAYALLRLQRS